jgi:hypothetical protein
VRRAFVSFVGIVLLAAPFAVASAVGLGMLFHGCAGSGISYGGSAPPEFGEAAIGEPTMQESDREPLGAPELVFVDNSAEADVLLTPASRLQFQNGAYLDWSDGTLRFEGEIDPAARAFFEHFWSVYVEPGREAPPCEHSPEP